MPGENDDEYDSVDVGKGRKGGRLRWNRFKWALFFSNLVVSLALRTCSTFAAAIYLGSLVFTITQLNANYTCHASPD